MFAATISKSLYDVRVNEDLSRPADARQQPSHDSVVRLAAAALKLVLLDGPFGEGRGLICRLSLVLRKRHPLANDFPTRLVVFHVCGSLGCSFSTRPEATASFTASRNSSGLAHAIRTAVRRYNGISAPFSRADGGQRPDWLAGLRGLEIRNPGTSHV